MLTQQYLSFLVDFGGVIDLQCCNYCHLPNDFSSKFQSTMTIFHHKLLTREGMVLANRWTHPSSMAIIIHKCHRKSYHRDIKYHITLNIIFIVTLGNVGCYMIEHKKKLIIKKKNYHLTYSHWSWPVQSHVEITIQHSNFGTT